VNVYFALSEPIEHVEWEDWSVQAGHREDLLCDIQDTYFDDLPTAALEGIVAIIKEAADAS
jgi:hypothetical protein